jgi:glycosyltransferase involved in cell wall biosynthesis
MRKATIYIECSSTAIHGGNTGIQRTERNIVNASQVLKNEKIICKPIVYLGWIGGYKIISRIEKSGVKLNYFDNLSIAFSVTKSIRRLTTSLYPFAWIRNNWAKYKYVFAFFTMLTTPFFLFLTLFYQLFSPNKLKIRPSDIILISGPFWWHNSILNLIKRLKKKGCKIFLIIYDLTPIEHPHVVNPPVRRCFTKMLPKLLKYTDVILGISKSTANDVRKYLQATKNDHIKVYHWYLGSNIDLLELSDVKNIRACLEEVFENKNTYISVGTIEPRKNYDYLIDVFELLWNNQKDIKLCLIGKYGWLSENLKYRIKDHPLYGKYLFWFDDLSDSELLFCYQHARALIFPSICEGFGLPLIEALHLNCDVFASDIPIFHEIGGKFCTYFPLDTSEVLSSYLSKHLETRKISGKIPPLKEFVWPTWQESTEQLLKLIYKVYNTL